MLVGLFGPFHGGEGVGDLCELLFFQLPCLTLSSRSEAVAARECVYPTEVSVAGGGELIGVEETVECVQPDGFEQSVPSRVDRCHDQGLFDE